MRFLNFFFNYMPQEYQNEKSPILNGQKKPRTWGKVQKIRNLEGVGLFHPFENTLCPVAARPLWILRWHPNFASICNGLTPL